MLNNTDGYRSKKGQIFINSITATTEIDTSSPNAPADTREELLNDINLVGEDLGFYYESIFLYCFSTLCDTFRQLDEKVCESHAITMSSRQIESISR